MSHGRPDSKIFHICKNLALGFALLLPLVLSFDFGREAQAFGVFGSGAINPYWLGGQVFYRSGFTTGQGMPVYGQDDGMMTNPAGVSLDSSGNIFVIDTYSNRLQKFNSSGVFQGWIGEIGSSPTGGAAGCNGAAVGTFTPGWCTGGNGHWGYGGGTGDGMIAPTNEAGMTIDSSGNIYVMDGHDRISKYNSAGAFQGWIGKIGTSPTGGAAGCNGAAAGSFTPGWCKGGASASGTGNGALNYPSGVAMDVSGALYVADSFNHRISKYSSTGAFQGWIGAVATSPTGGATGCNTVGAGSFTPGWCTGGTSTSGSADGMMAYPIGVALDSAGNLYVADSNNRINKYNSSGVFQGWIGAIGTSPTGGATGCNGAAVGTMTPGWCTGGAATNGTGDGMINNPAGLAIDSSNNIYLADSQNHRILKYNSAGVFQGWIGKIGTSPTGGAAGCNGAAVETFTPGWCTGGTATNGNGDGMFHVPTHLTVDSSGNIYVSDQQNNRISKFNSSGVFLGAIQTTSTFRTTWWNDATYGEGNGDGLLAGNYGVTSDSAGNIYVADSGNARINKYAANGTFIGWIGKIGTSPTGGAAGCNGAAVGTFTPGWCTGGTSSTTGTGDGMMKWPTRVRLDSSGNLYVIDSDAGRVLKFSSAGAFLGWIGKIATSPTGGAAGCNGAAVGTITPGWCTGGTSDASGSGDGVMSGSPYGLALDSSGNIYVVDTYNNRIMKFASTGAYVGWIGNIGTSPTGGDAGCNGATVGTFTPGWCTGGDPDYGNGMGMLNQPEDIVFDSSGNFYVVDTNSTRINKYSPSAVPLGWIGTVGSTTPTGGAAGCTTTAQYAFTPGWCTGGTPDYGSGAGDGSLGWPEGITVDSQAGYLYVADGGEITKYKLSTGAFIGWIGWIGTSPTGGGTGCKNAAVGDYTPNWCKGGGSSWEGYVGLSVTKNGDLLSANASGIITRISLPGH